MIYTTSSNGTVSALNKKTGRLVWQTPLKLTITAGSGIGEGVIVVGTRRGKIIALNAANGKLRWEAHIPGEILAAPAVGDGIVIIKATDGDTRALSISDGHERWSFQQVEPNLTLRGSSSPLIRHQSAIIGYANGYLAKLNASDGQVIWLQPIATPEGAFAIQRMIDIDADPVLFDHDLYAATYQGNLAALDWASGKVLWTHTLSSYTGMAIDQSTLIVTDAEGIVWAFHPHTGAVMWHQNSLKFRVLSAPALMGQSVIMGDAEGYLHWLDKNDGRLLGRVSLNSPIYATPIVDHHLVYVLTQSGYLAAYSIK
jgi:outer membrane protein assembly factor BamB